MKKIYVIFLLVLLAIIGSFYFDSLIVQKVSLIRTDLINNILIGITFISSKIIIFFFLTILFLLSKKKHKWILPLWLTLGLSVIVSFMLKVLIQRQRPFQLGLISVLPVLEKASHTIWNFSFPSFQAMLVFCAVPILSKKFPRFKYIWIVFAGIVAFSRVYFGLHFMSDVLVGGLIGYLLGVLVIRLQERYNFGKRIIG